MRDANFPLRAANKYDRLCDDCYTPMIGIMKEKYNPTIRRICAPCMESFLNERYERQE